MKSDTRAVVLVVLFLLLSPQALIAQTLQTPNTFKLDDAAPRPSATLADVSLLEGHWEGEFLGATAEELWLPPVGNSMLGVFRLYAEDSVLFYETMLLVEEEGSVSLKLKHFHADLRGWEEKDEMVTFRFVKASEDGLWFEGLTFLKQEDGSLQAYIAIHQDDGTVGEESFVYRQAGVR